MFDQPEGLWIPATVPTTVVLRLPDPLRYHDRLDYSYTAFPGPVRYAGS